MKIKKKSIQFIILSYTLLLILIQSIFCTFIIFFSNVTDKLDDSNNFAFSNMVSYRISSLEELFFMSNNTANYYNEVSEQINQFLSHKDISVDILVSSDLLQNQVLQQISSVVLDSLRNSPANSCFMILDNQNTDSYKNCIYLRDLEPLYNAQNHRDIVVKSGASSLMHDYGFTLDSFWTPKINTDKYFPFYNDILASANEYPDLSPFELGYFTPVFQLHSQDEPCIAYCIPLLDEKHRAYGVIGFDVTLDYLKTLLPHNEISFDKNASYLLAKELSDKSLEPILIDNEDQYPFFKDTIIHIRSCLPEYDLYEIKQSFHQEKISMCMKQIHIYREESPYQNEKWVIAAIAHNNLLFHSSKQINKLLLSYFLSLIIFTILCTLLLARRFRLSIHSLMNDLANLSSGSTKFKKTNIFEFDELANAIEKQHIEIEQTSRKIATILDSSEIHFGILEIPKNTNRIFCNHIIFDILCLDDKSWENNYIARDEIIPKLVARTHCFIKSHEQEDTFLYRTPDFSDKWLSIKHMQNSDSEIILFRDITEEIHSREVLMHERDFDVLTNLYNRRAFAREVTKILDNKNCTNGVLSIWDLDNLKYTNDTYGHDVGDKYICLLADTLKFDLNVPSICARLAGDEFTLFLYGAPNHELKEKLTQLHTLVMNQHLYLPDGKMISMSASAGMSCYTEDAPNYQELLRYADFAMYQIKKSSKGNIKAYDKESYIKNHILVQGQGELERIISEKAIRFFFQPIFSFKTNRILGYEALMRPISDLLGRPDNLIRVATAQAKLGQIEKLTWFHALHDFFNQKMPEDSSKLFINSLPSQILSEQDFDELEMLYQDNLSSIILEITEDTRSESDIEEKKRAFCSKWNIPLALDDYGAGYSNNDILFTRVFNYVKLDMKLVRNIHQSSSMQTLVQGMITYCHDHNLEVIAEGIEYQEEYDLLKQMEVDYGQGFYFGKPSPYLY